MSKPSLTDNEIEERRAVVREFCNTCSFCPNEWQPGREPNCRARGCQIEACFPGATYNVWALCVEANGRGSYMWGPLSSNVTRCPLYERSPLP